MKRVQKILPVALDDELVRLGKAQTVMRQWEEIVGLHLANKSAPDRFDRGTLWVAVEGSAWSQELRLNKIKILEKLNHLAGESELFTNVRFGVRKLPTREVDETAPAAIDEEAETPPVSQIRALANKRLGKWRDVDPT